MLYQFNKNLTLSGWPGRTCLQMTIVEVSLSWTFVLSSLMDRSLSILTSFTWVEPFRINGHLPLQFLSQSLLSSIHPIPFVSLHASARWWKGSSIILLSSFLQRLISSMLESVRLMSFASLFCSKKAKISVFLIYRRLLILLNLTLSLLNL